MFKKKAPPQFATPPLLIPKPDAKVFEQQQQDHYDEGRKFGPCSPTDHMMSPTSMHIYRKKAPMAKTHSRQFFNLSAEVPKRICPLPAGVPLILGSSSANRREILEVIHWHFTVKIPGIDEKAIRSSDFLEIPRLIAVAKAEAIIAQLAEDNYPGECVILTADQVCLYHGELREKPETEAEAFSFLLSYSNDSVVTVSAVTATHYPSRRQESEVDIATVHWNTIPRDVVLDVVSRKQIMQSAGAFRVEDHDLYPLIRNIEGTVDSVMGMPVDACVRVIAAVLDESVDSNAEPKIMSARRNEPSLDSSNPMFPVSSKDSEAAFV